MYRTLRFDAAADEAEAWSDALLEAGALAVDLSDPYAGAQGETPRYAEPGAESALWPRSRLAALFAPDADPQAALRTAQRATHLALPAAEVGTVEEQDWVRATQAQFAPIRIEDDLWIVPSWHAPPDPDAIVLRLDPGVAFGTGSHPTTRLCLQWLRITVSGGERVLDYGCGSGILAIAAARLGAGAVSGTDIDPQAVEASRANAKANGVDVDFALPGRLRADERYDVVVANILANPLILLAPMLARATAPGGVIALSGILADQADDVIEAYAPWFTLARWRDAEGWVLLAGARGEDA